MTVLSDRDIRRRLNYIPKTDKDEGFRIGIEPCADSQVQPASVDLTLDNEWLVYPPAPWIPSPAYVIDMDHAKEVETEKIVGDSYELQPGELILCSTAEYVEIPADIVARVEGKSSLGRLGLLIHATAGFIDPGFKGKITLEMYNLNRKPIVLRAGKPICQLSMLRLTTMAEFPYGHKNLKSKYQDQRVVTASRYDG